MNIKAALPSIITIFALQIKVLSFANISKREYRKRQVAETGMSAVTTTNKIEYIVAFISEFSKRHNQKEPDAYRYLKQYGVISLIDRCYDVMHTQSFSDMVTDMTDYCHRKGGVWV